MDAAQLEPLLRELLALPNETEWVEFKHNNSDPEAIGQYISALSNSATLNGKQMGYIVWGIEDGSHQILGTCFKPHQQKAAGNQDLEIWLVNLLTPPIDFKIYELPARVRTLLFSRSPELPISPLDSKVWSI